MKVLKEWFVEAPWGKLACISWGNPSGPPVLLVHGRLDSSATFIPLLDKLPEHYHYVGFDMPGNGRSQPFPQGVKLMRFHFIAAVQAVVEHLQWGRFYYISHSMGCDHGLYFNAAYPGRIKKLVLLDFGPSLQRMQMQDPVEFYRSYYKKYYDNYERHNYDVKLYSRRKAIEAVMRARQLSESQAELILSRNLIPVGDDTYRLSWDNRLRDIAPEYYPVEYYKEIFSKNAPPILLLSATDETSNPYALGKQKAVDIINYLQDNLKNFKVVKVNGGHDVHFTNPERCAEHVTRFLSENLSGKLVSEKLSVVRASSSDLSRQFTAYVDDMKEFCKSKL